MSKILKVAVTDARLMQEEPAYAVQKGALSVSVAPFQAISASSSQMTFQVLVPSLNVFIDRKIVLSTPLSFNASLFYGGARGRGKSAIYWCTGTAAAKDQNSNQIITTALYFETASIAGSTISAEITNGYALGQPWLLVGPGFAPNTIVYSAATSATAGEITLNFAPPLIASLIAGAEFLLLNPNTYDVPDAGMSSGSPGSLTMGSDCGQALGSGGLAGGLTGWCSAVSGKDLAWTQFPVQSSLVNMTATLNDCTVTTNGDTLREQILLTSSQETLKQRTTPTNADVFAWGRDDAQNNAGNFSTYSVSNQYGDVPNGAWPISWSSVKACTTALNPTTTQATAGSGSSGTTWPFLAENTLVNFMPATSAAGNAQGGGIGFYIGKVSTQVQLSSGYSAQNVLVPFLNYQPVWTTNFPGGDLYGAAPTATSYTAGSMNQFSVTGNILTLNVDVPPMCMVGARLYDATVGNTSVIVPPLATTNTNANGVFAIIAGLYSAGSTNSGVLGKAGSQYIIVWSSVSNAPTLRTPGTYAAGNGAFGLQGGCPVYFPLPVFGTIACTEPMVISPLIWADSAEFTSVGLYGMTNMQFVLNFSTLGTTRAISNPAIPLTGTSAKVQSSQPYWVDDLAQPNPNTGNILRSSNIRSVLSDLTFANSGTNGPWGGGASTILQTTAQAPTMYATFLTPGVDVQLPDVSTVPYSEFPRYFYSTGKAMATGDVSISSQTISLTSIPDMLMVYVRPKTRGPSQLDQYIPVKGAQITFDNFSNLCSSYQQPHLYECAVAAGLDMDWHQWRGYTQAQYPSGVLNYVSGTSGPLAYTSQSPFTQTSGGPLLLRFGQDITLQPGLAPGCLGNYSLQVVLTLDNSKGYFTYTSDPVITIIAINSGFFETMRGQSAIRKTILQMADVAAATTDSGMSKTHLNRMIGRGNYLKSGSNMLQKGLGLFKTAGELNKRYGLTDLARTYGGATGARLGDMADSALSSGAAMHDSLYGGAKRHRSSGL